MQTQRQVAEILHKLGRRPDKRLGQCFLVDLPQMQRVLETADLAGDETILEVGPGTGSLTEELLQATTGRVVCAEYDRYFCRHLRAHFAGESRLSLIEGDALAKKSQIAPTILEAVSPRCVLLANLPYAIATPLVADCLVESWRAQRGTEGVHPQFDRLTFTVQKEVAERLAARGGSDYGAVSAIVGALGRVTLGRVVKAGSFWPAPKIDSQIVRIDFDPEAAEGLNDVDTLQSLLRQAFTQRRKNLLSGARARGALFPPDTLRPILETLGLPHETKPTDLTPETFVQLANQLQI